MADPRAYPKLRHAVLPAVIFLVAALASLLAALALWRSAEERDRASFEAESRVSSVAVSERLERQTALLRGAAALFAARGDVEAREFAAYVERIGLTSRYPGVLGMGYAARISGSEGRDALVARMRSTAASGYQVKPEGTRAAYHPVVFMAPLNRRNRGLVGYDMRVDPIAREAFLRAARKGAPAASGRVLVQGEDGSEPGFLLYLPVYRDGRIPINAAAREAALEGCVFSPFRARDLLNALFPGQEVSGVEVAIYDRAVGLQNLFYATGPVSREGARFYAETPIDVAGRTWVVVTAAGEDFGTNSEKSLAWWIALLGLSAGVAVALAVWSQARATLAAERARADLRRLNETLEARIEARTSEVTAAYAGIQQEVERRQGAEEQVRQMQKMEAVGQLTGGIAHDFNNMLAIVIGNLDMAKRRSADPQRVERLIDNAMEGATRAAALTQRLLAFSRRQPLNPEPVDVNRLVAGMSELLRRTLGETIVLDTILTGGAGGVLIDVGQLENAIINLAVNARDAMPGGGTLTIETGHRRFDAAYVDANPSAREGDYVMISVSDTGEGMSPETLGKAFDPFFTTKEVGKGTGLGLSQVFGFIQQSGGHVEIASTVGEGTSVGIHLPRQAGALGETLAGADRPSASVPRGATGEIILVVEDEDQVRLMSVEALRDLGYTVLHASSGEQALRKIREYPGILLLFTDVVMPNMNGRELADAARTQSPHIKLLFTTGYTGDTVALDASGGVDLVPKPFTFEQLATKVRGVLDAKQDVAGVTHGDGG